MWLPAQTILGVALWYGLGTAGVVYGIFVRLAVTFQATWTVNSFTHSIGYRNFSTRDRSTNNPLVALLTWGEGWHNNHHAFPASPKHGVKWYEIDPSFLTILILKQIGLAWSLRLPSAEALGRRTADRCGPGPGPGVGLDRR